VGLRASGFIGSGAPGGHGLSVLHGGRGSDLVDVREAALRLGVKPHRVYQWADTEELRSIRLSTNTLRFRSADITAFILARSKGGQS
jgi:hypothetical protein